MRRQKTIYCSVSGATYTIPSPYYFLFSTNGVVCALCVRMCATIWFINQNKTKRNAKRTTRTCLRSIVAYITTMYSKWMCDWRYDHDVECRMCAWMRHSGTSEIRNTDSIYIGFHIWPHSTIWKTWKIGKFHLIEAKCKGQLNNDFVVAVAESSLSHCERCFHAVPHAYGP